jgi:hypothetical protein
VQAANALRASLAHSGRRQTWNRIEQRSSDDEDSTGSSLSPREVALQSVSDPLACIQILTFAAKACVGRRTVCRLLRIARTLAEALVPLPPSAFEGALVAVEFGPTGDRPFSPARHRSEKWRRYGHAAFRQQRLWQRTASLCGAIDAFRHGIAFGPQLGRAGDFVAVAGAESPVALPVLVAPYSSVKREPETVTSPQAPCGLMRRLLCAVTMVSQRNILFFGVGEFDARATRKACFAPEAADAD